MKKIAFPLLLLSLCLCSCEKKIEDLGKKLSFEEAKEFVINHPQEKRETIYTDNLGNKRPGEIALYSGLGNSGIIKITDNPNLFRVGDEVTNLVYKTCYFDYTNKFVLLKETHDYGTTYQYRHLIGNGEYEYKICDLSDSNEIIVAYSGYGYYTKEEVDFFVERTFMEFNFGYDIRYLRFALPTYIEDTEAEFAEKVQSYDFYLKDDCLVANEKVKTVVDKNGFLVAGSVIRSETDEIFIMSCDYTINSKGMCTQGKTGGKYKDKDYLMYQIETAPLDNSFNNELQTLNQLIENYEQSHLW